MVNLNVCPWRLSQLASPPPPTRCWAATTTGGELPNLSVSPAHARLRNGSLVARGPFFCAESGISLAIQFRIAQGGAYVLAGISNTELTVGRGSGHIDMSIDAGGRLHVGYHFRGGSWIAILISEIAFWPRLGIGD